MKGRLLPARWSLGLGAMSFGQTISLSRTRRAMGGRCRQKSASSRASPRMALTPAPRQRVEKDSLERKPCADLSDTRVVQLDVRVIAEVGIRYTYVRSAKDHVVERIQCLETER
jgi:hypothetical protein